LKSNASTTERYLGCKQKLDHAVNDNLGLEDTSRHGHGPQPDFGTSSRDSGRVSIPVRYNRRIISALLSHDYDADIESGD
jgi:hypothetical protein